MSVGESEIDEDEASWMNEAASKAANCSSGGCSAPDAEIVVNIYLAKPYSIAGLECGKGWDGAPSRPVRKLR